MSIASLDQVKALVQTTVDDPSIQEVIDREEAYLARELRGPLTGSRTQRVYRRRSYEPIYLVRPTTELDEVRDNDVILDAGDVRLLENGTAVEPVTRWTGPAIELDYEPNDENEVRRVVIELCRLTLVETGYNSETLGGYTYQRSGVKPATAMQIQMASRRALIRPLLPGPKARSVLLTNSERLTPVGI